MKGIDKYGLDYKKNDKFELGAYTDVDWFENIDDRKNTNGGAFF